MKIKELVKSKYSKMKINKNIKSICAIMILVISVVIYSLNVNVSALYQPGLIQTLGYNFDRIGYTYKSVYTNASSNGYYALEMYHYSYKETPESIEGFCSPEPIDPNYHYVLIQETTSYNYVLNVSRNFVSRFVLLKTRGTSHSFKILQARNPWYYSESSGTWSELYLKSYIPGYEPTTFDYWISGEGLTWTTKNPTTAQYPDMPPLLNGNELLDLGKIYKSDSPYFQYQKEFAPSKLIWTNKDILGLDFQESIGDVTEFELLHDDTFPEYDGPVGPPSPTPGPTIDPNASPTPIPDEFDGNPLDPDGTLPNFNDIMDGIFNFPDMPEGFSLGDITNYLVQGTISIFAGLVKILEYLLDRMIHVVSLLDVVTSRIPFAFHAMMLLALILAIILRIMRGIG